MLRAENDGMVHLRGVSGDMSRQRQDGTCPKDPPGETLANCTGREPEQKDFSYKETKWKSVGRCRSRHAASYKKYNVGAAESDDAILLKMSMQQNILGGKGICWTQGFKEWTRRVLSRDGLVNACICSGCLDNSVPPMVGLRFKKAV